MRERLGAGYVESRTATFSGAGYLPTLAAGRLGTRPMRSGAKNGQFEYSAAAAAHRGPIMDPADSTANSRISMSVPRARAR